MISKDQTDESATNEYDIIAQDAEHDDNIMSFEDMDTLELTSALQIVNSPSNCVFSPRIAARKRRQSINMQRGTAQIKAFKNFPNGDDAEPYNFISVSSD